MIWNTFFKKIFNFLFPPNNINYEKIKDLIQQRIINFEEKNLFYFLPYQNKTIKKLFIDFKFYKKRQNAKIFGEILYDHLPEILEELSISKNFHNPILIPIPISFFRKMYRKYDQNILILKHFKKLGGNNFIKIDTNILKKIKHTKPQSHTKNKIERKKNIKNSFKVINKNKLKNKNVILFDDIYTTGATLKEAERILKKAGAKNVIFITIAH